MKESKPALLKSPKNSPAIDDKKEIDLLKQKLKECRKKYNSEKRLRKNLSYCNNGLFQKNYQLEGLNKKERARSKYWQDLYASILSAMSMSADNYLNLLKKSDNLYPCLTNDMESEKAEFKKIIDTLSSLIKKNDLLGSHSISEFLSNKN